jgi:hypothetical protein
VRAAVDDKPLSSAGVTAGGDVERLRGLPAIGRGVSGSTVETDPVRALLAKERRRRKRRVILELVLPDFVRAEVQRILDREARLLLAARLDRDPVEAAAGGDDDPVDDGPNESTTTLEGEGVPVARRDGHGRDDRGL